MAVKMDRLALREKRASHSLTALVDNQRAKAASYTPPPEQLARWKWRQEEALKTYCEMIDALMERIGDVDWPRYYLWDARYRYTQDTLALIAERDAAMVCMTHGINGGPELTVEQAEALSLRGMLDGHGAAWYSRYCGKCVETTFVAREARKLMDRHKEAQG